MFFETPVWEYFGPENRWWGDDANLLEGWDEDAPVTLEVLSTQTEVSTFGIISVYDENGKAVPMTFIVSLPPVPNGQMTVSKGELFRVSLYWMGSVNFAKPGRYYAVAVFSDAFIGKTNVRFTTKKHWFQVVAASPVAT